MKKRLLLLPILLLSLVSCQKDNHDKGKEPDSYSLGVWSIGEGEPVEEASAGDIYVDTSTSSIYIFKENGWEYLCQIDDSEDFMGMKIREIDGEIYYLKAYSIAGEVYTKWEKIEMVDTKKMKKFTQISPYLCDSIGQPYAGYYSLEKTNKTIYGQGGTIFNNRLFVGQNNGYIQVKDFETNEIYADMLLDKATLITGGSSVKQPHNNNLSWAYNGDSSLPLVYTNCYSDRNKNKGTLCVYSFSDQDKQVDEDIKLTYVLGDSINSANGRNSKDVNPDNKYGHVTRVDEFKYSSGLTLKISTGFVYMVMSYAADGTYLGTTGGKKETNWTAGTGEFISLDFLASTYPTVDKLRIAFKDPDATWTVEPTSKTPEEAGLVVHRKGVTTGYSNKLEQIIKVDFLEDPLWTSPGGSVNDTRPYGNFVVDPEGKYLYAIAAKTAEAKLRFFKFKLPDIKEGDYVDDFDCTFFYLYEEDIIEYFDTPYAYSIQDVAFHDHYIYINEGFTNNNSEPARMRVVDVTNKKQVAVFDIYRDFFAVEPEFLAWYEGELYYGDASKIIYKVNLI